MRRDCRGFSQAQKYGRGAGSETLVNCVAPGLLEGTRATANLRPEQVVRSASGSLLKKAADNNDCTDMVVTMCRTVTMTGQTIEPGLPADQRSCRGANRAANMCES